MTNNDLAKSYVDMASLILKEAEALFQKKVWHLVVRRAQECVELCLKALLRSAGIEIPRIHDVGFLLKKEAQRFPGFPLDRLVAISRRLREEREMSFYGDELTETPPTELYDEHDAKISLENAHFVKELINKNCSF